MTNCLQTSLTFLSRLSFLLVIGLAQANAYGIHGRFTLGSFISTEEFTDTDRSAGTDRSDYWTTSSRMYMKMSKLGLSNYETVIDIRDKHDFFDKLDQEKLELTDKNTLQVRQLVFNKPSGKRFYSIGRFPVQEAGSAHTDGLRYGFHIGKRQTLAFFGGLNPKTVDQSALEFNSNTNTMGIYHTYDMKGNRFWDKNLYMSHAIVTQGVDGETDRQYIYHQLNYQWNRYDRFHSMAYLDFVPSSKIQTIYLGLSKRFAKKLFSHFSHRSIDAIEYSRRQGVREKLEPSPYSETQARLRFRSSSRRSFDVRFISGSRQSDGLSKQEISVGGHFLKWPSRHWDIGARLGNRDNFASQDTFVKVSAGYYSRKWEFTLDQTLLNETQDSGESYSPMITEISFSRYFSRSFYGTFYLQSSSDSRVAVFTTFFKLGYRFGTQEIPPVRDGAPPRGRL